MDILAFLVYLFLLVYALVLMWDIRAELRLANRSIARLVPPERAEKDPPDVIRDERGEIISKRDWRHPEFAGKRPAGQSPAAGQ